ncbi:MAG: hypothetical protein RQ729_00180 [Wenzhouxiangellaceae bacterium]|nr:hypothetical protein [Wenzhouxiangellaceae bacterium]
MHDTTNSNPERPDLNRRRVIGSALGLGAAGSLGLLSIGTAAATTPELKPAGGEKKTYRETEHIRRYYQTSRMI